jgi:hypothetical protein
LNNFHPNNFLAFIWLEKLENEIDFYYPEYPVFIADFQTFHVLTHYDIEEEKGNGNYFLNIICTNF